MGKKIRSFALPVAAAIAGNILAPGIGTALGSTLSSGTLGAIGAATGSGAANLAQGGNLKSALLTAGGSYLGSQFLSPNLGTIGEAATKYGLSDTAANAVGPEFLNPGLSSVLGESTNNAIGAQVANTGIGSIVGGYYGGNVAPSLVGGQEDSAPAGPAPYTPARQGEQEAPLSIQGLGALDNNQQSTNLATQGVYGGGLGPEESGYFLNLINRRLIDDSGQVDQNMSDVNPIEQSYLQMLGLGGAANTNNLLEAISKWRAA